MRFKAPLLDVDSRPRTSSNIFRVARIALIAGSCLGLLSIVAISTYGPTLYNTSAASSITLVEKAKVGKYKPHTKSTMKNTPLSRTYHTTANILLEALDGSTTGANFHHEDKGVGDAENYLAHLGIPHDLAQLQITYGNETVSKPGREPGRIHEISVYSMAEHKFLKKAPKVISDQCTGPCTLVMLDPDTPGRIGDGVTPGKEGPFLHWLVKDIKGDAASGKEILNYTRPDPVDGNHRYIFVLFQQDGGDVNVESLERKRWDFQGFLDSNPGLTPVAMNFFYAFAKEGPEGAYFRSTHCGRRRDHRTAYMQVMTREEVTPQEVAGLYPVVQPKWPFPDAQSEHLPTTPDDPKERGWMHMEAKSNALKNPIMAYGGFTSTGEALPR